MAQVIITFKIMPESVDQDLDVIHKKAEHLIKEFGGEVGRVQKEPIGFGLVALKLIFIMSEDLGSTEDLEEKITALDEVASVDVVDVRRAIG